MNTDQLKKLQDSVSQDMISSASVASDSRNQSNETRAVINLSHPIRSERVRGFQPPWRTVYVYRCANGHEMRIRANSFRGGRAEPGIGGVYCNQCDASHLKQVSN